MTQDGIKEKFIYDNGNLKFRVQSGSRGAVGKIAGCVDSRGYIQVKINGKLQLAHRAIYLMHYGWLPNFLDHENGIKSDNRIENLRPATSRENSINRKLHTNSSSGVTGVNWHKQHKKWVATVSLGNGRRKHLGLFTEKEDAITARQNAEQYYYGDFARKN